MLYLREGIYESAGLPLMKTYLDLIIRIAADPGFAVHLGITAMTASTLFCASGRYRTVIVDNGDGHL